MKRAIALFLCLIMCVSLFPAGAFAEEENNNSTLVDITQTLESQNCNEEDSLSLSASAVVAELPVRYPSDAEIEQIVTDYLSVCNNKYWNKYLLENEETKNVKNLDKSYSSQKDDAYYYLLKKTNEGDYASTVSSHKCDTTLTSGHNYNTGCKSYRWYGVGCDPESTRTIEGKVYNFDSQCAGFASYMLYVVYHAGKDDVDLFDTITSFSDYTPQPGDNVRAGTHSYFIYKVSGSTAYTIECNKNLANGEGACQIYSNTRSFSSIKSKADRVLRIKKATTHTISFNANGGSGSMSPISKKYGEQFTIPEYKFERPGYSFSGWNLFRESDSTWYVAGKGWKTASEISQNGYTPKLYPDRASLTIDNTWVDGLDKVSNYTFYAVWVNRAELIDKFVKIATDQAKSSDNRTKNVVAGNECICAEFAWSCAKAAGFTDKQIRSDKTVKTASPFVLSGASQFDFIDQGGKLNYGCQAWTWKDFKEGRYKPQKGDLVFFGYLESTGKGTADMTITEVSNRPNDYWHTHVAILIDDESTTTSKLYTVDGGTGDGGKYTRILTRSINADSGKIGDGREHYVMEFVRMAFEGNVTPPSPYIASGTCGANLTWTLSNDGVLEISGTGAMTNYTNSSSAPWYSKRGSIKSVKINSGVTSIGNGAFSLYTSLTNVSMTDSVTSIGSYAFQSCANLSSVIMSAFVTSFGDYAFFGCSSLTNITIPNKVTSIGDSAFSECSNLSSLKIGSSVMHIGDFAFSKCTSLTGIELPNSVTYIGESVFSECSRLRNAKISSNLKTISAAAFFKCGSLTGISIPSGVTAIGEEAFFACKNLASIEIPASVTSIYADAFFDCISLANVYYAGSNTQWEKIRISGDNECLTDAKMHFATPTPTPTPSTPSIVDIKESVNTYVQIQSTSSHDIKTEPYSTGSKAGTTYNGEVFTATKIVKNSYGNYWYYIPSVNGYINADDAKGASSFMNMITFDGTDISGSIKLNSSKQYHLPGTVKQLGDLPITLKAEIIPSGSSTAKTSSSQTFSGSSLTLCSKNSGSSSCKNAVCLNLKFSTLSPGVEYIYRLTAEYTLYYCAANDDQTLLSRNLTSARESRFSIGSSTPTTTHTIFFNSNGGGGYMSSINVNFGNGFNLPYNAFNHGGDYFKGWNLYRDDGKCFVIHSDGDWAWRYENDIPSGYSKKLYTDGRSLTLDSSWTSGAGDSCDFTFYAVWESRPGCGSNISWELSNGILRLNGSGSTYDYNYSTSSWHPTPWLDSRSSVTAGIVGEGITGILESVFEGCTNMTSISFPSTLRSISQYAFYSCNSLEDIYFAGTESQWRSVAIGAHNDALSTAQIHYNAQFSYPVTYHNVDSPIASQTKIHGVPLKLSETVPSEGGNLVFEGWSTSEEAEEVVYSPGDMYYEDKPLDLWAVWRFSDDVYFVWYFSTANEAVLDGIFDVQYHYLEDAVIGSDYFENEYKKDGYVLAGWNTEEGQSTVEYFKGDIYKDRRELFLSAVWIPETYAWGRCGDHVMWTLDDEGTLTISGTGAMTDYSYSSTPWYSYNSSIKKVVISSGVTTIGNYAFNNCYSLTDVTIPNSVVSIGDYAFYYCDSLTSVTIGNSVTSIGNWAFGYCESLTSVTIPNSVTSIGNCAFDDCFNLTSVTIGNSVTSIGNWAFIGCTGLKEINVSEQNKNYSSKDGVLFNKNKTLLIQCPGGKTGAYSIPDSVTTIGNYAFNRCYSLTDVTIPNSVVSIGDYAFYYCTSLTSVTIGNSVTSIGNWAFGYCESLTSVTIPNSVTSIGNYAFYDCFNLTSVTIGNSVTSIGGYAFYYCTRLTDVYYTGSEEQFEQIEIYEGNDSLLNAELHCGHLGGGKCGENTVWTMDLEGTLTVSGTGGIFSYPYLDAPWASMNSKIKKIVLKPGITSIGLGAFSGCTALTSVTFPDTLEVIGMVAFSGCTGLTEIKLPDSLTVIVGGAFSGCTALTDVYYNATEAEFGLIEIGLGNEALMNAAKHFETAAVFTLPAALTKIEAEAFMGIPAEVIIVPEGVADIGSKAFADCPKLRKIIFLGDFDSITIAPDWLDYREDVEIA